MRLNAINPQDNPMDKVLYCFGSAGDFGDESDQQTGQGSSDDSRGDNFDERDKVARDAGVPRNTIVGSGPGGRNIVTSGDGSPVKSSREVEKAAEKNDTTVEEINRRIDKAYEAYSFDPGFDDTDVADTSALDEIAAEFDFAFSPEQAIAQSLEQDINYSFDPESIREEGIAESLRQDYSAVFDQATTRGGQQINVDPDASIIQSPAGQAEGVRGGKSKAARRGSSKGLDAVVEEAGPSDDFSTERGRAITNLITAFESSKDAQELSSSKNPQQQVQDLLASIGERVTELSDIEPFSIERIQNLTDYFRSNPANPEILQTSAGDFPVSELLASTQAERAAAADAAARAGLDASTETTTQTVGDMTITEGPDGKTITRGNMSDEEAEKIRQEGEAKKGLTQKERMDRAFEDLEKQITADVPDPSRDPSAEDTTTAFLPEQAIAESLGGAGTDEFAQARVDLGLPEDATVEDIQNALDAKRLELNVTYPDPDPFDLDDQADYRDRRAARTVDEDTGLPVSARQAESPTFSDPDVPLYGDEDYLDLYGAEPGVSLVDARLKAQEDLDKGAEEQGDLLDIPFTFIDDVLNQLFKADALTKERLEGGDFAIYSTGPTQEIIGSVDKDTGAITPSSDNFFNAELNPYYEEYERQQELARPSPSENEDIPAEPIEIAPEVITPYDFDSIIRSIVDGTETETGTGATDGTESLPAVGQPAFDFMRDFGAFSLSPQPDDAPEGIYSPTYLAPISELTAEQRQELSGLLGTPLGAGLGLSSISFDQTPMETAEALIESLSRDQSS